MEKIKASDGVTISYKTIDKHYCPDLSEDKLVLAVTYQWNVHYTHDDGFEENYEQRGHWLFEYDPYQFGDPTRKNIIATIKKQIDRYYNIEEFDEKKSDCYALSYPVY